jgi:XTP/dITP diphosphohydrolase
MTSPLLLIATTNQGKLAEYRELLREVPYTLVDLADVGVDIIVTEDGKTFKENAIKKAREFARASDLLALADDSGIEVDALNGHPGIYSARYAPTDEECVQKLLQAIKDIPLEKRTARFCCVIALAWPAGHVETCEGVVEGMLTYEPRGTNGFGYDPIFLLPDQGLTTAELPAEEKNYISHRGQAARKAANILSEIRKLT